MKYSASVITISDKCYSKQREDSSGPAICEMLSANGFDVKYTDIVPDESNMIEEKLIFCADELKTSLIVTTGGTGFSQRDITPEATSKVIERQANGISEAMRAESMRITPRGCLSRGISGLRKNSLIINLPGSKKAAAESLGAVIAALVHAMDMLDSQGSANCAETIKEEMISKNKTPSLDEWLKEAKKDPAFLNCGMYLIHNGVVRRTSRAYTRGKEKQPTNVIAMDFSYDENGVIHAIDNVKEMSGIEYVKVWLNRGRLDVGDDIMLVIVGGDTRPHVIDALQCLVDEIKTKCVTETEIYE